MSDHVFIEGLVIETCIGVYDWERKIRQKVVLDLELERDLQISAQTDDLADTLDYKTLCDRLIERVEASRFELLEALAQDVINCIFQEFAVAAVRLRLSKPGALSRAHNVGVVMQRRRTG